MNLYFHRLVNNTTNEEDDRLEVPPKRQRDTKPLTSNSQLTPPSNPPVNEQLRKRSRPKESESKPTPVPSTDTSHPKEVKANDSDDDVQIM